MNLSEPIEKYFMHFSLIASSKMSAIQYKSDQIIEFNCYPTWSNMEVIRIPLGKMGNLPKVAFWVLKKGISLTIWSVDRGNYEFYPF